MSWQQISDLQLNEQWNILMVILREQFKQEIKMEGIMMLIGMREMGLGYKDFSKQEKTDLIHVGTCTILDPEYYRISHRDDEQWPHYELQKPLPNLDVPAQTQFLRYHVVRYFMDIYPVLDLAE